MKMWFFYLLSMFYFFSFCQVPKEMVIYTQAQQGNTGYRGKVPKEEMNIPRVGNDFCFIELKSKKSCTIELKKLIVKKAESQYELHPLFENKSNKMILNANMPCIIRSEMQNSDSALPIAIPKAGRLELLVNGRKMQLDIDSFELLLPQ